MASQMLGVSLRARWDTNLVNVISTTDDTRQEKAAICWIRIQDTKKTVPLIETDARFGNN